jgi:hypothetical protein
VKRGARVRLTLNSHDNLDGVERVETEVVGEGSSRRDLGDDEERRSSSQLYCRARAIAQQAAMKAHLGRVDLLERGEDVEDPRLDCLVVESSGRVEALNGQGHTRGGDEGGPTSHGSDHRASSEAEHGDEK